MAHAQKSPSSSHRWMLCPGSVALESVLPDTSSEYADEGTVAHALAAGCLSRNADPHTAVGGSVTVREGVRIPITDEMATAVGKYVGYVRMLGGTLMVEQELSIEHLTGEAGATGTSDAVVLLPPELIVVDLKYGMGVRVDAQNNPQLMMYALAALEEFALLGDFQTVRMVIHQPRLDHVSEWVCTVGELQLFAAEVKLAAERVDAAVAFYNTHDGALHEKYLSPGDEQCRFCRAKATCPALATMVLTTISEEFVDLTLPVAPQLVPNNAVRAYSNIELGNLLTAVDMIESWCKAVRAQAEAQLLAGAAVPGYKLVEGKRGNRKWASVEQAEALLKHLRLKVNEMYDLNLISPTSAEKLVGKPDEKGKAILKPRQWTKLQALITQSEGKPSVAPESDRRPALTLQASADEFDEDAGSLV